MALYIGLMSGTSMDGIDAALVELPANKLIHGITVKYSGEVKQRIEHVLTGVDLTLGEICQLNTLIGREFASAVNQLLLDAGVSAKDIEAIGSHGQTVCHDTSGTIPYTLQLGCGHTISSLTGIPVIADFRTRDLVNGGQGAPFAPLYHQELFSQADSDVALVNIGGIANVSLISPEHPTKGWDVGPGNCLMDGWIYRHLGKSYDENGAWSAQGTVIKSLLDHLLSDPFFALKAPKSIGKEYFSSSWLENHLLQEYKPVDVQATLLALTAHAIAGAIVNNKKPLKQVYLCGGGTHNTQLRLLLAELLPETQVKSIGDAGFSPDYLEAMMFAWLAQQTMNAQPVDLSSITGSKKVALLGAVYPIMR